MSKIKLEKAYAKHRVSSFGGIREGISKNKVGASDIRNLRIGSNGSLEKRNGWKLQKQLSSPIRGFWEGTLNGESYTFVVCANRVYRLKSTEITALNGTLGSSSGNVKFQRYRDRLYLLDKTVLRCFSPTNQSFLPARGYVPLYGHNWHPTQMGDVNEPLNLLNQNLRIHYLNTTGTKTFSLPFFASTVDSVRVNNKVTTAYTFSEGSDTLTLSSASAGDVVEIAMTISGSGTLIQQLHGATEAYLFRDGTQEQLFLYGSPQGYRVFGTSEVADLSLTYCSLSYADCDPLYFKQSKMLLIGDADHKVTAITANFDRLLAFTTTETHSITVDGDKLYSYPVLLDLGCSIRGAAVQIGNDSIVFNTRGLCRLHSTASDPDNLSVKNLSEDLGASWGKEFPTAVLLLWDNNRQELWVRNPAEASEGIVWIWNAEYDLWYRFDNVYATMLFLREGNPAFVVRNLLCKIDDTVYTDGEESFDAYYQSNYTSQDSAHAVKRALCATVCANTGGATLTLDVETEHRSHSVTFQGKNTSAPEVFTLRLAPGRFRFLRYRITCTGENASKIHEANFFTNL